MKNYMSQVMKTILLTIVAVLVWLPVSRAYTPDGPVGNGGDAWQGSSTGYGPTRDVVGPKNLGEEYRRNVPVLYYTCDDNFKNYFGTSGTQAVDNAFIALNKAFTNNPTGWQTGLDGYSLNLSEFPLNSRHVNYQAQAFALFDLKSEILADMLEQLGLADPTYYVYGLHNWFHPNGTPPCPGGQEYSVDMRNFDYLPSPGSSSVYNQYQYSPYINDVLFTYSIVEFCQAPPTPWRWAQPAPVDLLADTFTPLASQIHALDYGAYYNGLTRDDAAGLRSLMSASTIKWETVSPDSLLYLITTNTLEPQVFPPYLSGTNFVGVNNVGYYTFITSTNGLIYGYGDVVAFLAFAKTNPPANVLAAYPGVVISSYTWYATIVSNATLVTYFTNAPIGSPFGSPPVLVITTNYNPVFQFVYNYTFANVITNLSVNHFSPSYQTLVSITVGTPIGSPVGSPGVTNSQVSYLPVYSGDFFVLPQFYTNYCPLDFDLPAGNIPQVLAITNGIGIALTNSTTTNLQSLVYTVTYFTNYSYVINPVTCTTVAGATGYYEGIQKIQFVDTGPTNFDSLLDIYTVPITNNYTLNAVIQTNGQFLVQPQNFQRIVTRPDFIISALDLTPGPNSAIFQISDQVTAAPFNTADVPAGLAGPGTIASAGPEFITFNKDGPLFFNSFATTLNGNSYFIEPALDQIGQPAFDDYYAVYFLWGSFDGTTNAPVIYPNGTSIDNVNYQILVNVSPTTVPGGTNGLAYPPVQFTATTSFFVTPFTWSAANLPPGLSLTSNADNTATLSGTPTQSGNYTFTLTLTDGLSRSVQVNYFITIQ